MTVSTELNEYVEQTISLLTTELNMQRYEADYFREKIAQEHFFEFWFSGKFWGSYKILVRDGAFFIFDQNDSLKQTKMESINLRLKELLQKK